MIVGSLLLILGAVVLLVLGLARGSSPMLISSIVASLLAAVALVVGARQAAARSGKAAPAPDEDAGDRPAAARGGRAAPVPADDAGDHPHAGDDPPAEPARADAGTPAATPYQRSGPPDEAGPGRPADAAPDERPDGLADPDPEDPADEPRAQWVRPADAAQLAVTTIEVLVVDGRPRYHLTGCPFLAGRESEAVPVAEAIDLGFTPCGTCRPADRLVAAARHP
jgi:hypothetical protein